jgi:hypothetical protein
MGRLKRITVFLLLVISMETYSQPTPFYFKDSEMKGIPAAMTQFASYASVKDQFTYFTLDETSYKAIFHRTMVAEGNENAKFRGTDIILPKKLAIGPTLFPGHKLTLNPKLEAGYFSKHALRINIRGNSVTADFDTDAVEWEFPANVLSAKNGAPAKALVNVSGVQFQNDGSQNRFHGLTLRETGEFHLEPAVIPGSFIELTDCSDGEFQLMSEEAFQYPNLVFENTRLCWFLAKYGHDIKSPGDYKSSVLIKDVKGKITLQQDIACNVSEIYFFEHNIAGILTFPLTEREHILGAHNYMNRNTANRSAAKLKPDGGLRPFFDIYQNTQVYVEEGLKSIKMYFLIVK